MRTQNTHSSNRADFGVPGLGYRAAVTATATAVPPSHELIPGTPAVKVIRKFPKTCHSVHSVCACVRVLLLFHEQLYHIPSLTSPQKQQ